MEQDTLCDAVTKWAGWTLEEWLQGYHNHPGTGFSYRIKHHGNLRFRVEKQYPDQEVRDVIVTITVTEVECQPAEQ